MAFSCTLREWQTRARDPAEFIVQASAADGSDSAQAEPIGFAYTLLDVPRDAYPAAFSGGRHAARVLCNISPHTDSRRRGGAAVTRASILATLAAAGIYNVSGLAPSAYFCAALPATRFVISPEGNGIDCHRHYEALMAGAVPVMERHPQMEAKYAGCPVLWTRDYSEITPAYLDTAYERMLDTVYDFSALMLSSYSAAAQEGIRARGNVWCMRLRRRPWYYT